MPQEPRAAPGAVGTGAARKAAELHRAATRFNLAAHPLRLAILLILAEAESDTGRLSNDLGGLAPSTVSQLLGTLRQGELIRWKRRGKGHLYDLTEAGFKVVRLVKALGPLLDQPEQPPLSPRRHTA